MSSDWVTEELTLSSALGIDPDVEWALNEGEEYLYPSEEVRWLPVLVEFAPGSELIAMDFGEGSQLVPKTQLAIWQASVRALRIYTIANPKGQSTRYCSALVTRAFFEIVLSLWKQPDLWRNYERHVARVTLGLPLEQESLPPDIGERAPQ